MNLNFNIVEGAKLFQSFPLSRITFPFKQIKVSYSFEYKGVNEFSYINLYKIKDIYKPSGLYTFHSIRKKGFISEDWIFNFDSSLRRNKKKLNINLKTSKKIFFNKPIFFISYIDNYSYIVLWNLLNILFLLKNNVKDFIVVLHDDKNKHPRFNEDLTLFLKKYFKIKVIKLNYKKDLLIKSETLLFSNIVKSFPVYSDDPKCDFFLHPKEYYTDLPEMVIKNKYLKKYFSNPRNDVILISRKDSRIINNENEIIKKFPYIKLVQPEKLKLEEEISLIYNSKIVIGTYGAALINVLFARPNTTFVRLIVNKTDKNDFKNDLYKEVSMFEAIAATKKMRIVNMNVGSLYGHSSQQGSYFNIDIKKFSQLLERIT